MDWYEWEPEDVSDYDTEDWGDAELLWGGRSTPRGSALARRLALARRTAPAPARRLSRGDWRRSLWFCTSSPDPATGFIAMSCCTSRWATISICSTCSFPR